MNGVVLDASAALAYLWREPGWEVVQAHLARIDCVIGAVNLAEVISKAVERGLPDEQAGEIPALLDIAVVPLDAELAVEIGRLRRTTRALGLSLGDRACLALGKRLAATVVTADRVWRQLDFGVPIELIRPEAG